MGADHIHTKDDQIVVSYAFNVWMMTKRKIGYMTETTDLTTVRCWRLRGEDMTIKEAYEIAVQRMMALDKEIAILQGRRDAYDEMRSYLYSMMNKVDCNITECKNCNNHNYCDYDKQKKGE